MISSLKTKFKGNEFLRSVSVLVSGNILSRLIGLITLPIVSRLYTPDDFGENGVIVASAAIIASIGSLGLNSAVMLPEKDKESDIVFQIAFFSSSIIYFLFFLFLLYVSKWFQIVETSLTIYLTITLIALSALLTQLHGLLKVYINRKGLNKVLFTNSVISSLSTLIITIPLGYLNFGVLGLVLASLTASLICSIQMIYHSNPFHQKIFISDFIKTFKRYRDFLLFQYPSNFIGTIAIQFPIHFLSQNFGNEKLGMYNMNERIMRIPIQFLAAPITTIYFRTASHYVKQKSDLASFTFKLIRSILLFSIIPVLVMILWGEDLFRFVLGDQWGEAGKLASILIIQYVFDFCSSSISYCRVALNRQRLNLWVVLIRLGISVLSLYIGIYVFRDVFATILTYSISMTVFFIIDMVLNFYALKNYAIKFLFFSLCFALVGYLLVFLL